LGLLYGPLAVSLTGAVVEELHRLSPFTETISHSARENSVEQSREPEFRIMTSG